MFCNRACKERAQGAEGGLFPPPNYKTGAASYRTRALRVTQACQECGFGAVPEVLEVHHIDHNRGNNGLENLRVLCPTCHAIAHFRAGTGKYGPKH